MNSDWLLRTEMLVGAVALEKIRNSIVLIAGLGGVGGYALEALARYGVGNFILVDSDTFEETNLNRQLLCTKVSIGLSKVSVAKERILSINSQAMVSAHTVRLDSSNIDSFLDLQPSVVVDAIDSVESKCFLLEQCISRKIAVVSSMGAALRKDPTLVRSADISKTSSDSLAKIVRTTLRKNGIINGIDCVYSTEKPMKKVNNTLGSIVTVTGTFGLVLAQLAVNKILEEN